MVCCFSTNCFPPNVLLKRPECPDPAPSAPSRQSRALQHSACPRRCDSARLRAHGASLSFAHTLSHTRSCFRPLYFQCMLQASAQKPPNCPQLLNQAEQKVAAAGKALDAAILKMNQSLPVLTDMVTQAHANETKYDTLYNAAMKAYSSAITAHANAVDQLNLAKGKLAEDQNLCSQPVHPKDCPDLIQKAKDAVQQDQTNLVNSVTALNISTQKKNQVFHYKIPKTSPTCWMAVACLLASWWRRKLWLQKIA